MLERRQLYLHFYYDIVRSRNIFMTEISRARTTVPIYMSFIISKTTDYPNPKPCCGEAIPERDRHRSRPIDLMPSESGVHKASTRYPHRYRANRNGTDCFLLYIFNINNHRRL
jgi:hypothetical protein